MFFQTQFMPLPAGKTTSMRILLKTLLKTREMFKENELDREHTFT
ncbi:hypothetical protein FM102_03295 [Corynebacterium glutamicum]|nr:hypothetical protein FM102_03295 [Corynebacterium glutamicum]